MSERNCCYCEATTGNPKAMRRRGIPHGFCGLCRECGRPGHIRHSPIPAPFTGAWCDQCHNALGNAYDDWIARHPDGKSTEFMEQWREAHPLHPARQNRVTAFIAGLFRRF